MSDTRGNTKMCSVLFVDIVGYSKKTNSEQMALKARFVSLWNQAISDVPGSDIMVVDSGDGAAMTSLVEPEDTIRVALKLKGLLEADAQQHSEPMLMRMGINFGPVQLSNDVHGKPCVVGDAINIAQRIMSFSDSGQIMISRSYFDVITPLSHKYAEMFYYLGKRADKHIRYHDVYGLGGGEQSGALGVVMGDELAYQPVPESEESTSVAPVAMTPPTRAVPVAQPVQSVSAAKGGLPGRTQRAWGSVKDVMFFIFVFFLIGAIYELSILGPMLRNPDAVKLEIGEQIQYVRGMLTGGKPTEEAQGVEDAKLSTDAAQDKPVTTASHHKKRATDAKGDAVVPASVEHAQVSPASTESTAPAAPKPEAPPAQQ